VRPGLSKLQVAILGAALLGVAVIGALEGRGRDQTDPCPVGKPDRDGVYSVPAGSCIRIDEQLPPNTGTAPVSNLS
jgi:hypothetical protein